MRVRRAVVTGGAGFVGSHLCHRLLQDGYEVICLDDFCTGNSINVEHLLEDRRFRLARADVTDYVHVSGMWTRCCTWRLRLRPSTTCSYRCTP